MVLFASRAIASLCRRRFSRGKDQQSADLLVTDVRVKQGSSMAGQEDGAFESVGAVVAEHAGEQGSTDAAAAVGGFDVHVRAPSGIAGIDAAHPTDEFFVVQSDVLAKGGVPRQVFRLDWPSP